MSIIFHNPGLVDLTAITTFGVNVKDSDSPIGFFGTGFKYAIAVILRGGGKVTLHRGHENTIVFKYDSREIRGKQFGVVQLVDSETGDVRDLGFTTELGKNWEPWMAYRELYCNAKDEGGGVKRWFSLLPYSTPAGETSFVIDWEPFEEIHSQRGKYFFEPKEEPLAASDEVAVYAGHSKAGFYKGVRVTEYPASQAMYTYDLRGHHRLTEDRSIDSFSFRAVLVRFWVSACNDKALIKEVVTTPDSSLEAGLPYSFAASPSEAFLDAVGELHMRSGARVHDGALELYLNHRTPEDPPPVELDDLDKKRLEKAIKFCRALGYAVDDYPIVVAETLSRGVLAIANLKTQKIYLAKQLFNQGTKVVAQALIEEFIHLRHGLYDESRALQTYLFETVVSLGERVLGEAL